MRVETKRKDLTSRKVRKLTLIGSLAGNSNLIERDLPLIDLHRRGWMIGIFARRYMRLKSLVGPTSSVHREAPDALPLNDRSFPSLLRTSYLSSSLSTSHLAIARTIPREKNVRRALSHPLGKTLS